MNTARLGAVAAVALGLASGANAATPITGLYNTGVDNSDKAVTGNGADTHWSLTDGTAYTGGANGRFPLVPGGWLLDTNVSRWLTPGPNASTSYDITANHTYVYTTTFNLTDTTGASFTGQFAADNSAVIKLNGVSLASEVGYNTFTNFSATSGFKTGTNIIEVDVTNVKQNGYNPTGLNVQFLSSNVGAAPEPSAWSLMILGVGGMGAALRTRRRKAIAA